VSAQSVTDFNVARQSASLFELLWQLPTELVLDFLERANEWELRNSLTERLAQTAEMIRAPVALTPSLRDRSDRIAQECAEYVLRSNATLSALIIQLERGAQSPLEVQWSGVEHLRRIREGGRPAVVFAPHIGFLYAVPVALAAVGERSAVLGGDIAREVMFKIFVTVAPRLLERIDYIVVPSPGCAMAAVDTLRRGELLVMFPEVNRGATGNIQSVTTEFLGRRIWLPTTAARFARMARADILPALVTPTAARQVRIEFGEPVAAPADRHADVPTSLRLFEWLERTVEDRPHLWWGWPMLDIDMKVIEPAAGRE
jgi:lauroyl/myristoyl acyltransferase